jgi:hypothetical protein
VSTTPDLIQLDALNKALKRSRQSLAALAQPASEEDRTD